MIGFQDDADKFLTYVLIMILLTLCGAAILSLFGAMSANMEMSNNLATTFLILFMLFDGTWVDLDRVPDFLAWIRYISFMGIAVRAMVINEMEGLTFCCCKEGQPCFTTGEEALVFYNFDGHTVEEGIV